MTGAMIERAIHFETDERVWCLIDREGCELRRRASDKGGDKKGTPSMTEPPGVKSVHCGDRRCYRNQVLFNHEVIRCLHVNYFDGTDHLDISRVISVDMMGKNPKSTATCWPCRLNTYRTSSASGCVGGVFGGLAI